MLHDNIFSSSNKLILFFLSWKPYANHHETILYCNKRIALNQLRVHSLVQVSSLLFFTTEM